MIYTDIVKLTNDYYAQPLGSSKKDEALKSIFFKVSHFISNSDKKNKQGSSKIMSSVKDIIQGKRGLVREALMGKRVNFAGRTVANGGSFLRVDEIGLPKSMAEELTRPIVVCSYNREELQHYYDTGKVKRITMKNGSFADQQAFVNEFLHKRFPNYKLQHGDIVDRQIMNGDVIMVGRQPTLHKQNLMSLRVILIDDFCVRINLSITTPLNADFDGDELHIHVPQTVESYVEAEQLLSIGHNLMSSQTNNPMMAITYDTLTAAYLLTEPPFYAEQLPHLLKLSEEEKRDVQNRLAELEKKEDRDEKEKEKKEKDRAFLERQLAKIDKEMGDYRNVIRDLQYQTSQEGTSEVIENKENDDDDQPVEDRYWLVANEMDRDIFDASIMEVVDFKQFATLRDRLKKQGIPWGTRKALFSSTLPEGFYYEKVVKNKDDPRKLSNHVIIRDGILISGIINKEMIGRKDGNIITELYQQFGSKVTIDFMSHVHFVMKKYVSQRGFTVGIDDCIPTEKAFREEINLHIERGKMQVEAITIPYGEKVHPILAQQNEQKINQILDDVKTKSDNIIAKYIRRDNNLRIMGLSGAKGEAFQSIQISSMLGSQKEGGKRMPADLPGGRSLAVFKPGDPDPASRGFCENSFSSQLTAEEFFFHNVGSREGLVNTGITTAETGSLQNRIIKSVEDVHIGADGSVRSGSNSIISFTYEDGFDASHLTNMKINNDSMPFFRNIDQLANIINNKYNV